MKSRLIFSLFILASCANAQSPECNLGSGAELPKVRQEQFSALLSSGVDSAAVRFDEALAYAKVGNYQKALFTLEQSLEDTPWLDPVSEADFKPISGCAAFQRLVSRIENKYPAKFSSKIAFTVNARDLIPEGLASDPADGSFYLSSIYHRKIVKIAPEGKSSDFVAEGQDGLLGVLGMKVDIRDHSVWAASERSGAAALFHFDPNGKTLARFDPADAGKHLFNDLVITPQGQVLVTDSENNSVYSLAPGSKKLVRYGLGKRYYPNGIALSSDGKTVFVAHAFGIVRMDLNGESVAELRAPRGISLAQIDGLYCWQGSLIAIQNGFGPNRIVRLQLTPDGKVVSSGAVLEFRSPNLELPTTGTILKGRFYFIVNSQIDHEDDGKLRNEIDLKPIKVAVLTLQ
jgi:DNA-binding beta-propeller fold protein YncE